MDTTGWNWPELDTVLIGVNAVIGGMVYLVSRTNDKAVANLKAAPQVEVGPQLEKLLRQSTDSTLPYVAIRGQVQTLRNVDALQAQGVKGVIKSFTVNEHSMQRYGSGFWGTAIREIASSKTEVPFGLKSLDTSSSSMVVEVIDPIKAAHINLLKPVDTKFEQVSNGFASTIIGYFSGRTSTGIETTEKLLPIGTNITAVGKLTKGANGSLRIMSNDDSVNFPYYLTTNSATDIVDEIESVKTGTRIISYVFFGIGIILATNKAWKYYKWYSERRMRERILRERRERELERRANNPPQLDENGVEVPNLGNINNEDRNGNQDNTQLCIICLVNPRELILLPCGHVALCVNCLDRLDRTCPVCRNPISSTHVAYIA